MKQFIVAVLLLTPFVFWVTGDKESVFQVGKNIGTEVYSKKDDIQVVQAATSSEVTTSSTTTSSAPLITHIQTPEYVKAVYMSSWVAGTPSVRARLINLIEDTELNAVVIDVKDNTGVLSWDGRIRDLDLLIKELHDKDIYVIARIAAFQDPLYVKRFPNLAVMDSVKKAIWKDRKGVPWIDTGSHQMWEYLVQVGKESYEKGFDELNYDYIRFPTDGNLKSMEFPISGERAKFDKRGIVKDFYKHLYDSFSPLGIPISGDVFGIITTNSNETKTLGQDMGDALMYFDYVAPMVYPSHFYAGTAGYTNPAAHPGPIITYSMGGAITGIVQMASSTGMATSTLIKKLRPWYQDFDMGATYTADMVRAQISAGEKLGVGSWMLWDPANRYTPTALKAE